MHELVDKNLEVIQSISAILKIMLPLMKNVGAKIITQSSAFRP